jgi:hypothetical protein
MRCGYELARKLCARWGVLEGDDMDEALIRMTANRRSVPDPETLEDILAVAEANEHAT